MEIVIRYLDIKQYFCIQDTEVVRGKCVTDLPAALSYNGCTSEKNPEIVA